MKSDLYEVDFYGWTQQQAQILKDGRLSELDTMNLMAEIGFLGEGESRWLESSLEILFMYLLMWRFQPVRRCLVWDVTIKEQRSKIARHLNKNPSLKRKLSELAIDAYSDAVLSAARDSGLDESTFPESMPWPLVRVLDPDYLPE